METNGKVCCCVQQFLFSFLFFSFFRVVAKVIDVGKVPQKERLACIQEVKVRLASAAAAATAAGLLQQHQQQSLFSSFSLLIKREAATPTNSPRATTTNNSQMQIIHLF